jgi:Protein tyrosine and serine/threonine kinase
VSNYGLRPRLDVEHPKIKELIENCWNENPKLRPTFKEIIESLESL